MGDPAGVGPEIILKTLQSPRTRKSAVMMVAGYSEPFERDAALLNMDINIKEITLQDEITEDEHTLHIMIPPRNIEIPSGYGSVDKMCGLAAASAIELSAELAVAHKVDAVVTAPINKESLNLEAIPPQ